MELTTISRPNHQCPASNMVVSGPASFIFLSAWWESGRAECSRTLRDRLKAKGYLK